MDHEDKIPANKLPYPKSSLFILAGYFLERFVYYGLFGGVVLYMQRILNFSAATSSTLKAVTEGLIYLAPVAGAVLADSYFGKFRTVFTMCRLYIIGTIIFTLSSISAIMPNILSTQIVGIFGMFVFGLAAGLIKAVYSSLGPDQFKIPEQRKDQQRFFLAFYWMINAGAFVGQIMTAQLRSSVQCFANDCYVLPFALLCCLMVLSTIVFYCGKSSYIESPPDEMLLKSFGCIFYACQKSITNRKKKVEHWIDRSKGMYNENLIEDVKKALRVLLLFVTFPLFWALFYQTSTGMIFQAKRLNGRIGSYQIPPEITSSINPLFILVLIPLCEFIIYPILEKNGNFKDMKIKMALGMMLGCASFVVYGVINTSVEQNILGTKQAQLNVYNAENCTLHLSSRWFSQSIDVKPLNEFKIFPYNLNETKSSIKIACVCEQYSEELDLTLMEKHETTIVMIHGRIITLRPTKHYIKDKDAEAKVRIISDPDVVPNINESLPSLVYGKQVESFIIDDIESEFKKISPKQYAIMKDNISIGMADIRQDGVYDIVISDNGSTVFNMTKPSDTHMLWLLPQYLIITTGEVLFSVSGMDFAYVEAPTSMKSVMQAANLFTITIGLWIFAFITKLNTLTRIFEYRASTEAFTYAFAMAINTILFMILVRYYNKKENKENNNIKQKKKLEMENGESKI